MMQELMQELIDKYEREIEDIDADMRDGHDNGFRAGKLAALVMVVGDLKEIAATQDKPGCVEIAEERQEKEQKKVGHWTDRGSLSCRCSECGCKSTVETDICPVCGAKMEVGK